MRVLFTPEKQVPSRSGELWLDNYRLVSGVNTLPDDFGKHPSFSELVKLGAIAVLDTPKKATIVSGETKKAAVTADKVKPPDPETDPPT